jgi:hypothetical protein
MGSALATVDREETRIARPLAVLVPLIKEDIEHGKEAAERAGMPYYQAAGEKLMEARSQFDTYDAFIDWVRRNFGVGKDTAALYMKYAKEIAANNSSAIESRTLGDFVRKTATTESAKTYNTFASRTPVWKNDVREVVSRVDTETLNLKREDLKRQEERDAQKELALQLIDIGYKVLARELHPDKGGSREAMVRLNAVRDRLKQSA